MILLSLILVLQSYAAKSSCKQAYKQILNDNVLKILIVYGYKDSRPQRFVADRHEKLAFAQIITSACTLENNACEFERSPDDADLFARWISIRGKKKVKVQLRLVASSVGPDDADNKNNPYQKWMSAYAKRTFARQIQIADVVFYNGHSRAGGGPDFEPPLLYKTGSVDYGHYQRNQPGLKRIKSNMTGKSKMKLFGIFSCASTKHFIGAISKKRPDLAVISSRSLLYHADSTSNMMAAFSSILDGECRKGFRRNLRSKKSYFGSQIYGL